MCQKRFFFGNVLLRMLRKISSKTQTISPHNDPGGPLCPPGPPERSASCNFHVYGLILTDDASYKCSSQDQTRLIKYCYLDMSKTHYLPNFHEFLDGFQCWNIFSDNKRKIGITNSRVSLSDGIGRGLSTPLLPSCSDTWLCHSPSYKRIG